MLASNPASSDVPVLVNARPRSNLGEFWRQYRRHRGAVVGTAVFALIVLVVVVGPMIYTVEPSATNVRARNQAPSV